MDGGTLSIYRKLYEDAGGDMDVFFQMANGLPGVKGEVVEKGRDFQVKLCQPAPSQPDVQESDRIHAERIPRDERLSPHFLPISAK